MNKVIDINIKDILHNNTKIEDKSINTISIKHDKSYFSVSTRNNNIPINIKKEK